MVLYLSSMMLYSVDLYGPPGLPLMGGLTEQM